MTQAEQALREGVVAMSNYLKAKQILPPNQTLALLQTQNKPPVFTIDWGQKVTSGSERGESLYWFMKDGLEAYPNKQNSAKGQFETKSDIIIAARRALLFGYGESRSETTLGTQETINMKPSGETVFDMQNTVNRSEMVYNDLLISFPDNSGVRLTGLPKDQLTDPLVVSANLFVHPEVLNWQQPLLTLDSFMDHYTVHSEQFERMGYLPISAQKETLDHPHQTNYTHVAGVYPALQVNIMIGHEQLEIRHRNPTDQNDVKTLCITGEAIKQLNAQGFAAIINLREIVHPLAALLKLPDTFKGIALTDDHKIAIRRGEIALLTKPDGSPAYALKLKDDRRTLSVQALKPKNMQIPLAILAQNGEATATHQAAKRANSTNVNEKGARSLQHKTPHPKQSPTFKVR